MNKKYSEKKFEEILLDSIDEALSTLGENARKSIYYYVEKKCCIQKQDIPNQLDNFLTALEQIFGLGTRHLELLIMKNLNKKVGGQYTWEGPRWLVPDLTFRKYVELMRLCYEDTGKIGEIEVIIDAGQKQIQ